MIHSITYMYICYKEMSLGGEGGGGSGDSNLHKHNTQLVLVFAHKMHDSCKMENILCEISRTSKTDLLSSKILQYLESVITVYLLFVTGYPIYDASCVALNTVRKWLEKNADVVCLVKNILYAKHNRSCHWVQLQIEWSGSQHRSGFLCFILGKDT